MSKTTDSLLDKIEHAALDPTVALSDALRLCITLGGRLGSSALRDWATNELNGYRAGAEVPDYRTVPAALYLEITNKYGVNGHNQQISPEMLRRELPEDVWAGIREEVRFAEPIKELEEHGAGTDRLRISYSNSQAIAAHLTRRKQEQDPLAYRHTVVAGIFWSVTPATLRGVVDQIRTALVVLIAELREKHEHASALSARQADEALEKAVPGVHIHDSPGTIVNITQGDAGGITNTMNPAAEPKKGRFWPVVGWTLAFVATAIGTYAGLGQWLGWPAPWK
ncbi:hypothetical protein Psi02_64080 [Planotetraspora silvatica]|uniref:AbiTii domain-containing protein n=1 Tax=Planotetraspora silvatica TaxID=234614 RepID=A0A8J3XR32_9ACTN|nr:hypothetical protein [Planotetraspora silvatica]GII49984.1 hypothetical protein Psi02_64080 [Planotetraspora silvatica]